MFFFSSKDLRTEVLLIFCTKLLYFLPKLLVVPFDFFSIQKSAMMAILGAFCVLVIGKILIIEVELGRLISNNVIKLLFGNSN